MNLTVADLAQDLDGRPETISRWESEAQPMGGNAEKVFRLLACEEPKHDAPGISYDAGRIAHLSLLKDPPPAVELQLVHLKQDSGTVVEALERQAGGLMSRGTSRLGRPGGGRRLEGKILGKSPSKTPVSTEPLEL
jgi:hypothetical protein